MIVVYYDSDTGKATTLLTAPDLAGFPTPPDGQLALMLSSPARLPGYVEDFVFHTLPEAPSDVHVFDWASKEWIDPRGIEDFKAEKLAKVKAARDAQEFSPFTYNGMVFDGDLDAQRRLSVLVSASKTAIASGYSFTKDFTLADNSVVQLTAEDFVGIEMAKLWQVDVAFQEYRIKKAAIETATTIEELEAITI